ncbi:MAG TPA: amidase family protein [Solirubrobacteraceae bacterium]|nr:amidase family protein [Solirubrobacteraceae bacterium]
MSACVCASAAILCALGSVTAASAGQPLNLDTLSGAQAEKMMESGKLTSVELTEAYLARIAALNKSGPGLNGVTQINPDVLKEARRADSERAHGVNLGPAMGLPIILKDIIDATPMYTSAGDWALRDSYPSSDSGVAKELRAHGVVVLGKAGLSEWANSFGSQPSGFSNLTGQVLNALDTAQGPSGSSSGSGADAAAGLASLTIGTETSGSIISPATAQGDVGLRPTVGLVPGYGIAPIDASQDTAGPIERTVTDAAMTLQSIAEIPGSDPTANQEYLGLMGPNYFGDAATGQPSGVNDIPAAPFTTLPSYSSALTTGFVAGKRIGYNSTTCTPVPPATTCTLTPQEQANLTAVNALAAAGATMVLDPPTTDATLAPLPTGWEPHATIDEYYQRLGSGAPVQSLAQEVAVDNTDPQEGEKYGNSQHATEALTDDTTITDPSAPTAQGLANAMEYAGDLPLRKAAYHSAIDAMLSCPGAGVTSNTTNTSGVPNGTTTCPPGSADPVIAVIGSVPSSPQAGYPEMVVPMGYTPLQRRNIGVDITAGAYQEYSIIGTGYVLEHATHLQQPAAMVDPASYRCAHTVPAEPFASRGHCNPDFESAIRMLHGELTTLHFPLETASAASLEAKMSAGKLSSEELVKAELTRIALANAQGPAIQAVRALNPDAIEEARDSDRYRARHGARGPLEGVPVLVDDSINAKGLATSGGSIALENAIPATDAKLIAKLEAAGAIVLGDTNTTELGGMFNENLIDQGTTANCTTATTSGCMPQGYSSLGGQVLVASDTNESPGGSSAGSAVSVSTGFAPLAVGLETGTDAAQMIAPAGNAGIVALKPTVGLVSRTGVLPVARSQDSPGPMGQTVTDVADELNVLAGSDPSDPATSGEPSPLPDYTTGLAPGALSAKHIAVVSSTGLATNIAAVYTSAVTELGTLGATATTVTPGTGTTAPSVIPYEFHKGIDSFLSAMPGPGPKSLAAIIAYYNAHPVEGLKFGEDGLTNAESVNYADGATTSAYQANLTQGQTEDRAVIDGILAGGPYSAIIVPEGSPLVGTADRAGYPVLTVPAGYGGQNSSTGGDPIGVDFIASAYSEPTLLDYGYAFEQGTNARSAGPAYMITPSNSATFSGAPSETNQSMWRCVAGSAFFNPYKCNPGFLQPGSSILASRWPGR